MPHTTHDIALWLFRTAAALVGVFCFYLAFGMYEDEEGHWQNRIDGFWVAVDDRARQTNSKTVATLNKLAGLVQRILNRSFGERLFSFRAIIASMTVSISTAAFLYFCIGGATQLDREFITGVYSLIFGFCAVFPFVFPNTIVRLFSFLPPLILLIVISRNAISMYSAKATIQQPQLYVSIAWFVALHLSILSDVIVVYAIRRKFSQIANLSSTVRMVVATAYLVNVCLAASGFPYCVYLLNAHNLSEYSSLTPHVILELFIESLSSSLFLMNLCTLAYALVPCAILCFLVLHRTFWPTLARVVYAIGRNRVLTNKKFLTIAGVFCFALALNLGKETVDALKDLLKELG